ncbi:MAG: phosphotransferase family protein [Desertimonas sp.]
MAGIDQRSVTRWFADHIPSVEAPLGFERVAGGHSCLTFVVTGGDGRRIVLRRPPLGHLLHSAHDVLREHRIMSALADTDVPVPVMLGACDDPDVNDAPFYVMSHVEGTVLHDAADVALAFPDDDTRRRAGEQLADSLAALHLVDPDEVGLGDLARRSGYLDRQLKRWSTQWAASKTRELPAMERLHGWLVANRPADTPARIVHGDFRLGNMLIGPDGTLRAILDWELCTLGDPLADVSYLLRSWTAPDEPASAGMDPPTRAGGFPTRHDMAARYAERTGRDLGELDYYMAFNAWRSAAIAEGVYRRYVDGNMGERPGDIERYARSVEQGAAAGLAAAGLA